MHNHIGIKTIPTQFTLLISSFPIVEGLFSLSWLWFGSPSQLKNFDTTRPKPPNGRQGLAVSWGKDIVKQVHFGVFSTSHFTHTALSSGWKVLIFRHKHFFVTHGGSQLTFRTRLEKMPLPLISQSYLVIVLPKKGERPNLVKNGPFNFTHICALFSSSLRLRCQIGLSSGLPVTNFVEGRKIWLLFQTRKFRPGTKSVIKKIIKLWKQIKLLTGTPC